MLVCCCNHGFTWFHVKPIIRFLWTCNEIWYLSLNLDSKNTRNSPWIPSLFWNHTDPWFQQCPKMLTYIIKSFFLPVLVLPEYEIFLLNSLKIFMISFMWKLPIDSAVDDRFYHGLCWLIWTSSLKLLNGRHWLTGSDAFNSWVLVKIYDIWYAMI